MAHDGSGMAHGELKQSYEDLESAQALAVLVMVRAALAAKWH
jgi:hypothetical protein